MCVGNVFVSLSLCVYVRVYLGALLGCGNGSPKINAAGICQVRPVAAEQQQQQ